MIARLETMVLMGVELPLPAIRSQIASGVDIFVHLGRLRDKSRKVLSITEVDGYKDGEVRLHELFRFEETAQKLVKTAELIHTGKLERTGLWGKDGL